MDWWPYLSHFTTAQKFKRKHQGQLQVKSIHLKNNSRYLRNGPGNIFRELKKVSVIIFVLLIVIKNDFFIERLFIHFILSSIIISWILWLVLLTDFGVKFIIHLTNRKHIFPLSLLQNRLKTAIWHKYWEITYFSEINSNNLFTKQATISFPMTSNYQRALYNGVKLKEQWKYEVNT